ncbi:hypothetical protein OESDEN_13246 [Oesophagostomum dentatum]|uniref:Uncharacterized protein n=1 Tax=Oesophagostomum dentatum TaxID=61180 RepID=A0A0B1STY6_OESDE|nr:hypothetical protein OESDEN_13246 [Oesophagostomum dentatum]
MAAEAEATREAGAKVIAAEGEQKASQALREAAEVVCLSFSGKRKFVQNDTTSFYISKIGLAVMRYCGRVSK